jgi:hypothetical protein
VGSHCTLSRQQASKSPPRTPPDLRRPSPDKSSRLGTERKLLRCRPTLRWPRTQSALGQPPRTANQPCSPCKMRRYPQSTSPQGRPVALPRTGGSRNRLGKACMPWHAAPSRSQRRTLRARQWLSRRTNPRGTPCSSPAPQWSQCTQKRSRRSRRCSGCQCSPRMCPMGRAPAPQLRRRSCVRQALVSVRCVLRTQRRCEQEPAGRIAEGGCALVSGWTVGADPHLELDVLPRVATGHDAAACVAFCALRGASCAGTISTRD